MSPVTPLGGSPSLYDLFCEAYEVEETRGAESINFATPESDTFDMIAGSAFGSACYEDAEEPNRGFSMSAVLTKVSDTSVRLMNQILSLMGGGAQPEEVPVPAWATREIQSDLPNASIVSTIPEEQDISGNNTSGAASEPVLNGAALTTIQNLAVPGLPVNELIPSGELEWKPHNRYGLAEVVLPSSYRGRISRVEIRSSDQSAVLANGIDAGINPEGKAVWRFKQPGEFFPSGAILVVTTKDGESRRIPLSFPDKGMKL